MKIYLKKVIGDTLIILALLLACTQGSAAENTAVFTDITSQHPHFQAIQYLYEKGVIKGYPDHSFQPERELNRAEAIKIILLSAEVYVPEISAQEIFPDVLADSWYAKYVLKAKNLEAIKGDDATGLFRPGDTVNLAEAMKMTLFIHQIHPDPVKRDPYADVPDDSWFAPLFAYAKSHHLLDEEEDREVHPEKPINRGIMAELIYRLVSNPGGKVNTYASFYGDEFQGKGTASGEKFDQKQFTAAHRTYPFGTYLRVTNADNGKSVIVRVNDRGPYSGKNRVIDLSKAAFETIASFSNGVIPVTIEEVVEEDMPLSSEESSTASLLKADILSGNSPCPDAYDTTFLDPNSFDGIQLSAIIPQKLLVNEVLTVKGKTNTSADKVNLFLIDDQDQQTAFEGAVEKGDFEIRVRFPSAGHFRIGMIPGREGGSIVKDLDILEGRCLQEAVAPELNPISSANLTVQNGDLRISWDPAGYNLFKITLTQEDKLKSYLVKDAHDWIPSYADFKEFHEGKVILMLRGANLKKQAILGNEPIAWSQPYFKDFLAARHTVYKVDPAKIKILSATPYTTIRNPLKVIMEPKGDIREEAALITPEGPVKKIPLRAIGVIAKSNNKSIPFFQAGAYTLAFEYNVTDVGTHILEINDLAGIAALNIPFYAKNQYPLLPNLNDLALRTIKELGQDTEALRQQMLDLVNQDRAEMKLAPLSLDKSLNDLAQFRVEDMIARNYFGHWDEKGNGAEEIKNKFGIRTAVSENIAKEIDLALAEYGLMYSAIHRDNIINPEWTRLGVGIKKAQDGTYLITQIFSSDPIDINNLNPLREQIKNALNEKRTTPFVLKDTLNTLAQGWSTKMGDQDFFGWDDPKGGNLLNEIREVEQTKKIGAYIVENASFSAGLDQILENAQIKEDSWSEIGIGIIQDNVGVIKITLIYTE